MAELLGRIEAMVEAAGSFEELHVMLLAGFPELDAGGFAQILAQAILAGHLGGRVMADEGAGD